MGFKRWFIRGVIFSIIIAVCMYVLEILKIDNPNVYSLKDTIIIVVALGFGFSLLYGIIFRRKHASSPAPNSSNKFVVRGFGH